MRQETKQFLRAASVTAAQLGAAAAIAAVASKMAGNIASDLLSMATNGVPAQDSGSSTPALIPMHRAS